MTDARKTRQIDPPRPLRDERSAAALVAQYVHELSARHARGEESAIPRESSHRSGALARS